VLRHITLIARLKVCQFDNATVLAIPVKNLTGELIGKLVPVGSWILDDGEKIETIRTWRSKARRMFLTQLESTYEQTLGYLKSVSIEQASRLLFLLFDDTDKFVGHLGICSLTESACELDNFMRGASGGSPRLVYFAEVALLDWCFTTVGVTRCDVSVLTYNSMVIDLHAEVGFVKTEQKALRKVVLDGVTTHQVVDLAESNVDYGYVQMHLSKDAFLQKFGLVSINRVKCLSGNFL